MQWKTIFQLSFVIGEFKFEVLGLELEIYKWRRKKHRCGSTKPEPGAIATALNYAVFHGFGRRTPINMDCTVGPNCVGSCELSAVATPTSR